jgi:hypothetical protein
MIYFAIYTRNKTLTHTEIMNQLEYDRAIKNSVYNHHILVGYIEDTCNEKFIVNVLVNQMQVLHLVLVLCARNTRIV